MKTQKTEKAARCSSLRRRFAVNAKIVKRRLKGFAFGVYAWLTAACMNFIFGTQLSSLKKSIAGSQNEIQNQGQKVSKKNVNRFCLPSAYTYYIGAANSTLSGFAKTSL